jgi:hypothetical protein
MLQVVVDAGKKSTHYLFFRIAFSDLRTALCSASIIALVKPERFVHGMRRKQSTTTKA